MNAWQSKQIEMLYLEMFNKLMAYARSGLDSTALAEEAVQETFRIACQKPDQLCGSPNPQGWLVRTLKYTIKNIQNSRAAARNLIEKYLVTQVEDFSFLEDRVDLRVVYDNVADTEEFKLLFEMAIEGKSHEEMAKSRNITVSACRKRVQRAKETLQRRIKL